MSKLVRLLSSIVLMPALLISCKEEDAIDCMVSDQISYLSEFFVDGKAYHLYERRAGFSDKISYLEFYDLKPDFDQCGEPSKSQSSQIPVSDLGNNPVRVIIQDLNIDIEYGDEPYSSPDLSSLPVEVRE